MKKTYQLHQLPRILYCLVPQKIQRNIRKYGLHILGTEDSPNIFAGIGDRYGDWVFYPQPVQPQADQALISLDPHKDIFSPLSCACPDSVTLETACGGLKFCHSVTIRNLIFHSPFMLSRKHGTFCAEGLKEWNDITQLIVPNGIQCLDDLSFRNCKLLSTVIIQSDVEYIGCDSFSNCPNLASVYHNGKNFRLRESRAFCNNPSLSFVRLDASAKQYFRQDSSGNWYLGDIGSTVWFRNCPRLNSVCFSDGTSLPLKKL